MFLGVLGDLAVRFAFANNKNGGDEKLVSPFPAAVYDSRSMMVPVPMPPPQHMTVRYVVRHDPGNPLSPVRVGLILRLESFSWRGNSVDWRLIDLSIVEPADSPEGQDRVWHDHNPPPVAWRVRHSDVRDPLAAEFDSMPMITGRAQSSDPHGAHLSYTCKSRPLPPEAQPAVLPRAALDYWLQLEDEPLPNGTGQNEASDIDGWADYVDLSEDPPAGW